MPLNDVERLVLAKLAESPLNWWCGVTITFECVHSPHTEGGVWDTPTPAMVERALASLVGDGFLEEYVMTDQECHDIAGCLPREGENRSRYSLTTKARLQLAAEEG